MLRTEHYVCSTLLALLTLAGCQEPTAEPTDTGGAPAEGTDAGPRDTTAAEDTAPARDAGAGDKIDFILSGRYTGTATIKRPDGGSTGDYPVTAMTTEERGLVEGIVTVRDDETREPIFEYAIHGAVGESQEYLALTFSERRCPVGPKSACDTDLAAADWSDGPLYANTGDYTDGQFIFDAHQFVDNLKSPETRPAAILERLVLTPGGMPTNPREAPNGGFRPAKNDAGTDADTAPEPLPTGESTWSGQVSNGRLVGADNGSPADCQLTLNSQNGPTLLTDLTCAGQSLNDDQGDLKLRDGSFALSDDRQRLWFLLEGTPTDHLFVGRRHGGFVSGLIVRLDGSGDYWRPDRQPITIGALEMTDIVGGFDLTLE